MIRLAVTWSVLAGIAVGSEAPGLQRFETNGVEMALPIRLVFYAPDARSANRASKATLAEFRRLDQIFSDYDPTSESRRLCDRAKVGTAQHVSDELFHLLRLSNELSSRSGGAFDVTIGPITRLWRRALRQREMPSPARLSEARGRVGADLVRLDPRRKTVTLMKPGMRLDFGGIAKGYALDAAMAVLRKQGIARALIDAGGDIRLGDPPPGLSGWRIGIAGIEEGQPPLRFVMLSNAAVAHSGDARQHVEIDGRRYSHIVDPRSGIALTGRGSVTVIAPDATTADALASATSVLGPTEGIKLVERFPGTAALIVRAVGKRREVVQSSRLGQFLVERPRAEPGRPQ
jgi:thiamine biosynthesis lipoprotein